MSQDPRDVISAGYIPDLTPLENIQYQDAAAKRHEESKDKVAKRRTQLVDQVYGILRNAFLTLVGVIIAGVVLIYSAKVIASPASSAESKQFAFTVWGTVLGATSTFLFGEWRSKEPAAKA